MIFANTIGDWVKRYWLVFLVILTGLLAIAIFIFISDDESDNIEDKKKTWKGVRNGYAKELKEHNGNMANRTKELKDIKAIPDEKQRLQSLADFSNKKKNKQI